MKQVYPLKIDAYSHIVPPRYREVLNKIAPEECERKVNRHLALWNLDERFRIMDRYGELVQVITLGWPPIEDIASPEKAVDLCKEVNDEMAELAYKYPERFVAAVAHLPMNNMDAALKELDRVIVNLHCRGIQIYTPVQGKPLDSPEFMPLYEKMSRYNLPIFLHPMRPISYPDYRTETESKYHIFSTYGWPYETTAAMARLVFSGVLRKYPNLKIIAHHCGGMIPYYAERQSEFSDLEERNGLKQELVKAPIEYFKMFYADTALHGNTPALMCGYTFFGANHILFGADWPLGDAQQGYRNYRQTINAIDQMSISDEDKKKIFEDNARNLMHLPI